MFGKTSLPQSCRFHGFFSWNLLGFVGECLPSLGWGKVLASLQVAGKILLVLSYSTAFLAQGDRDCGEYSAHNHHILKKNGLFVEVAFCLAVGHCLVPSFDSSWSYLQPGITVGIAGCYPPIQDFLLACFLTFSLPC